MGIRGVEENVDTSKYNESELMAKKVKFVEEEVENPEALRKYNAFVTLLEEEGYNTPCANNPKPFVGWKSNNPPTAREARMMCAGCPLIRECQEVAHSFLNTHGVWGGLIFEGVGIDDEE